SAVAAATAAGLLDGGNGRLLVFDLGGTSLDVAVLDGEGEPLASHVDRGLGAETWGGRVADMLIRRFQAESGLDLRTDDQALQRVTEAAQTAVEQLSALEETAVSLPFIGAGAQGPLHLAIQVSRGDLAREAEGLIDRCHSAIRQATRLLPEIPEKSGRFERVLLIGGGTLIPTIAEVIDATYAERETVAGGDSPGLVARGAAMMAAGVPA
ncbi:MAG TPA: Hsp70 family protein, partial [Micromonosporaceae bacterium]|nr:Hsp70 family protein [Micromonosporaceae bacterium]